jgi:hypothetical protein
MQYLHIMVNDLCSRKLLETINAHNKYCLKPDTIPVELALH